MPEQLTPEKLKAAKFKTTLHLNGGSKFSSMSAECKKWNLIMVSETDGSPNYKIVAKEVQLLGGDAVIDLTSPLAQEVLDARIQTFCDEYNAERAPKLKLVPNEG